MPTFTDTNAPQFFTVATSGTYQVNLAGGQGGEGDNAGVLHAGGMGAAVGGDIFLTVGEKLEIIVGGQGGNDHIGAGTQAGGGGGGGGGSFLIEVGSGGDTLLAAAGGGGGGGYNGVGGAGHTAAGGAAGAGAAASATHGQGGAGGVGSAGGGGGGTFGGGGGGFAGGVGSGSTAAGASGTGEGTLANDQFPGGAGEVGFGVGTGGAGGFGGGGGGGISGGGGGGGYGGGGGGGGSGNGFTDGLAVGGGGGGSYMGGLTSASGSGGVNGGEGVVTLTLLCFVSGTGILTSRGEVAVENLAVGDLAVTAAGEARPIVWIGHRRIATPSRGQCPVRVTAGAFGENRPARDLWLSPGHAVCVDVLGEVFTPVGELVNGATIARQEVAEVTYWHVELASHDVLLAEGLPCESYMDAGARAFFGREYGRLAEVDPERVAESLTRYARPFIDRGPIVAATRARLAARAEALGWTRTADLDLHLVVDGQRVEAEIDGDLARFVFPAEASSARLASRTFTPDGDRRSLGVRVNGLRVSDGLRISRDADLETISGFHPEEAAAGVAWRWTDGDLSLAADLWAGCRGLVILTLAFDPAADLAWIAPESERARAAA